MDDRSRARLETLRDPAIPSFGALLDDGGDLWRALGHPLEGAARPVQLRWDPGRALVVRYVARSTEQESSPADFVASAGAHPPAGASLLRSELGDVAVWAIADDPGLPGLRIALDPAAVREMLAPLGVPRGPMGLSLRAYRPGRRAVVEARTGVHRFFLKVVRPSRIAALQLRHAALEGTLPVPASHGWSEHGLVVLEARAGKTLREALADGDPVPEPSDIQRLLDGLPRLADGRAAASQVITGIGHLGLVHRLAPEAARALDEYDLTSMIGAPSAPMPIHGDLHEAQLLVNGGRIAALLDVDTAGLGDPRDDWATFLGHLHVRACESKGAEAERLAGYASAVAQVLFARAGTSAARREIEARVAAVMVGLATGPFSVLAPNWADLTDRRIALAASWLRGEALRELHRTTSGNEGENRLIGVSAGSQERARPSSHGANAPIATC